MSCSPGTRMLASRSPYSELPSRAGDDASPPTFSLPAAQSPSPGFPSSSRCYSATPQWPSPLWRLLRARNLSRAFLPSRLGLSWLRAQESEGPEFKSVLRHFWALHCGQGALPGRHGASSEQVRHERNRRRLCATCSERQLEGWTGRLTGPCSALCTLSSMRCQHDFISSSLQPQRLKLPVRKLRTSEGSHLSEVLSLAFMELWWLWDGHPRPQDGPIAPASGSSPPLTLGTPCQS